jgi:uncharacterized protein (UPF0303 family)
MTAELPVFTIADLEQQSGLDVVSFSRDDAIDLGMTAVEVIRERDADLCVQIVLGDQVIFRVNFKNTGSENDPWLAGKAAVARHFGEPSLLVKLRQQAAGTTLEEQGLDFETYRAHGGSLPIRIGTEVVGTITMSGEPDVVDHAAAAEAVRRYVKKA